MKFIEKYSDYLFWGLFTFAFVHSVWAAAQGWYNPILDEHSFRQGQTALSAYFMMKGGPFFAYETPLFGAPWSIPFELPVYQWFVAKCSLLTGMKIDQSGRLVGKVFFYLTLWPLPFLLRELGMKKRAVLATLSVYLLSPMYLFWSRAILIESCAMFFAVAYLAACLPFLRKKFSMPIALVVSLLGALAGTVKVTTGFAFFLLAGFAFLYLAYPNGKDRLGELARQFFFAFVLPGIATIAWVKFSDYEKSLNPLADFIGSKALLEWNFGTWAQRIAPSTWYMFFRKTIHDSIGHRTLWMVSLAFVPFLPRPTRWMAITAHLFFFLPPMVFTNLHIQHNYYWMANGIFLVAYFGFVVDGLLENRRAWLLPVGCALAIAAVPMEFRQFHKHFLFWQRFQNFGFVDSELPLAAVLPEKDVVLIIGSDWYPPVPYGLKHRSLMVRDDAAIGSQRFLDAIKRTEAEGRRIGVVAQCMSKSPHDRAHLRQYLAFSATPFYSGSCDLFKVQ